MRFVFPRDLIDPRRVDEAFAREASIAKSFEGSDDVLVYRGWMMKPAAYARFFEAHDRRLVNSPEQYEHCHYLPRSYDVIRAHTPKTVWSESTAIPDLSTFGSRAVMLKDFVKSEKHAWLDACFIPDASDSVNVARVVRNFLNMRGDEFNVGLVFREFVELERVGVHPKSGMPLSREFRLFFLDGKPLLSFNYWDEVSYDVTEFPNWVNEVASNVRSRFFSMDLARTVFGEWLIVELGDGQVSGLPESVNPADLFQRLEEFLK